MMQNRLRFSVYSEMFIVDLNRVLYFQADDHYTHVYYANGNHLSAQASVAQIHGYAE